MAFRILELVKSTVTPRPQPAVTPSASSPTSPSPTPSGRASLDLLMRILEGLHQGSQGPKLNRVTTTDSGQERFKNGVSDYIKKHCRQSLRQCAQVACKAPQRSTLTNADADVWDVSLRAFSTNNPVPVDLVRYYAVQFTCEDPPAPPPAPPVTEEAMAVMRDPRSWGIDEEFSSVRNAEPAWWTQVTAAGVAGAAAAWVGQKAVQAMSVVPAFRSAAFFMSTSMRNFEELHDPSRQVTVD